MPNTDVLIVTAADDATADNLVPHLNEAGLSWFRWDPGGVPTTCRAGMVFRSDKWSAFEVVDPSGHRANLGDVGVVWYRRPSGAHAPVSAPNESVADFINRECGWFFSNFWGSLGRPIVNDPYIGLRASMKAYQLQLARSIGFETPLTYMGNDPDMIRTMWRETGGSLIVKGYDPRSVRLEDGIEVALFTSPIGEADIEDDAALCACPSIWQAYVEKKIEIRVTVIGNEVLAAEIHSQESDKSKHDWRIYDFDNTPYYAHDLPEDMVDRCKRLVRGLHLYYGAIDLILTPDGRYVFLEINPSGQWVWIEEMCGLPVGRAHARLFTQLARSGFSWRDTPLS